MQGDHAENNRNKLAAHHYNHEHNQRNNCAAASHLRILASAQTCILKSVKTTHGGTNNFPEKHHDHQNAQSDSAENNRDKLAAPHYNDETNHNKYRAAAPNPKIITPQKHEDPPRHRRRRTNKTRNSAEIKQCKLLKASTQTCILNNIKEMQRCTHNLPETHHGQHTRNATMLETIVTGGPRRIATMKIITIVIAQQSHT